MEKNSVNCIILWIVHLTLKKKIKILGTKDNTLLFLAFSHIQMRTMKIFQILELFEVVKYRVSMISQIIHILLQNKYTRQYRVYYKVTIHLN